MTRNAHGDFIWYELLTSDQDAAGRFYAEVVGWHIEAKAANPMDYRMVTAADGKTVAGTMKLPDGAPMRPGWLGYIGVDDVDATVADITASGGSVHMPATDLPGIGRMAMVADPQGAPFYVMRGEHDATSEAYSPTAIGHCSWNELATSDQPAALDFYTKHFGWTKGDVMPMGDMGDYQFIDQNGAVLGAVMTRAPGGPPPMWAYYFRITDIAAVSARITAGGGKVHHGPVDVPGGDRIIIAEDPQGAMFGLVGKGE